MQLVTPPPASAAASTHQAQSHPKTLSALKSPFSHWKLVTSRPHALFFSSHLLLTPSYLLEMRWLSESPVLRRNGFFAAVTTWGQDRTLSLWLQEMMPNTLSCSSVLRAGGQSVHGPSAGLSDAVHSMQALSFSVHSQGFLQEQQKDGVLITQHQVISEH